MWKLAEKRSTDWGTKELRDWGTGRLRDWENGTPNRDNVLIGNG